MNTRKPNVAGHIKNVLLAQDFDKPFDETTLITLLTVMCKEVSSWLSISVLDALSKGNFDNLISICDISPLDYKDHESYLKDAQIVALVKKYPYWRTSFRPKLEAVKTFIACELKCSDTNDAIWSGSLFQKGPAVNEIIFIAQKKIDSILGDAPSIEELEFEFGPGAAYGVKRNTTALDKLSSTLDVTANCYGLARNFLRTCPGWRDNENLYVLPPKEPQLNVVLGDRLSFVPKTAKTDRPIAIGPLLNVLIQKGLGSAIRHRLRSVYNLSKRQGVHRSLAQQASVDGTLCTIDLKSASDTIAYALVQELIPPGWFELLDQSRSERYSIEGKVFPYHKFSAMGNGYTFELETLIFYALAFAVCKYLRLDTSVVTVYGDDIIAPTAAFELLSEVLSICGFTVNSDKSFQSGPFRESCGGDFFAGLDARPFYLKSYLSFRTLFLFHNFLVKKGFQFWFPKTYRYLRKVIGSQNLKFFKTWNDLDDGALLDLSIPKCSYNTILSVEKNRRKNRKRNSYGVSFLLYRISLSDKQSDIDVDWNTYKPTSYSLTFRRYRHVHY